jgi:shikimate 5-dehydrogenase
MLVNQAAIAFRIWTGLEPDTQVMRDAVEEFLMI